MAVVRLGVIRGIKGFSAMLAVALLLYCGLFPVPRSAFGEQQTRTQSNVTATSRRGDSIAGKLIYDRYCHYCHGWRGYGDGPVGTAITPHPADFVHDTKRMKKSDAKLFKSISDGVVRKIGGEAMSMPRWASILSEKDIWDVLAYVRELQRKGRAREGLGPIVGK
jgi:mono/diheme cytochrome c family protein